MERAIKKALTDLNTRFREPHNVYEDIRLTTQMEAVQRIQKIIDDLKNGNYTDRRYDL